MRRHGTRVVAALKFLQTSLLGSATESCLVGSSHEATSHAVANLRDFAEEVLVLSGWAISKIGGQRRKGC